MVVSGTALLPAPLKAMMSQNDHFRTLRGNTGIYTNRGGTIGWLNTPDALVVVDSQYPDTATDCLSGLRQKNERTIDAVINTHHHGDHTAGNGIFRPHSRQIIAHENVPGLQKRAAEGQDSSSEQTYADQTFSEEHSLDAGGETIHLRHYGPAHTGGDSVVAFEQANVVHMGDLVFNRIYPFIDIGGGASVSGWIDTLKAVEERFDRDTLFIFGHAGEGNDVTGSRDDVEFFRTYLEALAEYTSSGLQEGRSPEEMKSAESLPGFDSMQGRGTFLSLASNIDAAIQDIRQNED